MRGVGGTNVDEVLVVGRVGGWRSGGGGGGGGSGGTGGSGGSHGSGGRWWIVIGCVWI